MMLDSKKIKKYLDTCNPEFKLFSMNYTDSEKDIIKNFILEAPENFRYYGSIERINDSLEKFLSSIGPNTSRNIKKMAKLVVNIIKKVLKGYNMSHFWVAIRVTEPNNHFIIPRWHKDGNYFASKSITAKFITVLRGPGTLLIRSNKKVNNIYNKISEKEINEISPTSTFEDEKKIANKYRLILAKKLANEKIIQAKNSQGLVFFAGSPIDNAALHSEPNMDQYRIFISIVPGSKKNIEALKKRWTNKK
jgi:hypothetical protein